MIMANQPRIVFMGTPEFAATQLKAIADKGFNVVGVVTVPDKPAGRGQKIQQSAVKEFALKAGLKILQPEKLKDQQFIEDFDALNPDIAVVVAFRMLPEIIWSKPKLGTFNLHASLLPQYRGAAPINWAIINGEKETGVTTFLIDKEIDTGKILFSERVDIGDEETAGELHDKLMQKGADLVIKTIEALTKGNIKPVPQPTNSHNNNLKIAPKIFKTTCRISWNKSAGEIHNLIRGLSPYPAAWTDFELSNGEVVAGKIFKSKKIIMAHNDIPGTLSSDNKTFIHIACSDGYIDIQSLQLAGKKALTPGELLRGMQHVKFIKAI